MAAVLPMLMAVEKAAGRVCFSKEASELLPASVLQKTVLVIEDEAMIAWMLESLLEEIGFASVMLASSAEGARKQAALEKPGLIVSDINLGAGSVNGITIVSELNPSSRLPTIFISGYIGQDERGRIDTALPGAITMRKPIERGELEKAIKQVMTTSSSD